MRKTFTSGLSGAVAIKVLAPVTVMVDGIAPQAWDASALWSVLASMLQVAAALAPVRAMAERKTTVRSVRAILGARCSMLWTAELWNASCMNDGRTSNLLGFERFYLMSLRRIWVGMFQLTSADLLLKVN